jgi:hypothetical protein
VCDALVSVKGVWLRSGVNGSGSGSRGDGETCERETIVMEVGEHGLWPFDRWAPGGTLLTVYNDRYIRRVKKVFSTRDRLG